VDLGNGAVWIEKLVIDTQPVGQAAIPEGPIAELKRYLADLRGNEAEVDALLNDLLPPELQACGETVDRLRLLDDVEALLMERLLAAEAVQ